MLTHAASTRRQWVEVVIESYELGDHGLPGWQVLYRSPGLSLVDHDRSLTEEINSALYYTTLGVLVITTEVGWPKQFIFQSVILCL